MKKIKLEIVTPEKILLKEEIQQVTVPTKMGEITVLPDHIPLIATLEAGVIELVKMDGSLEIISLSGGFIEVLHEKIVILADTAEMAADIDLARVESAHQNALKLKSDIVHFDQERFANISAKINKELARNRAAKKWKKLNNIK